MTQNFYCTCFITVAFGIVLLLTIAAVESSKSKWTSEKNKHDIVSWLSCSVLLELIIKSTCEIQIDIMYQTQ